MGRGACRGRTGGGALVGRVTTPIGMGEGVAVLGPALLLAWPALLNGYPILFTDTAAYLLQARAPWMIWDKPFVYGPLLEACHGFTTLWLPLAAQLLLVSLMLRLAARTIDPAISTKAQCGIACALAAGSAAPWVASLLMPDILAPLTVLGLFVLAFGEPPAIRRAGGVVATIAVAAHLSHLIVAASCIGALLLLRPRRAAVASVPLAVALALLLASNLVAYRRLAVSPFGSVFLLARLVADGPAARVLAADCPRAGWSLCAWVGRLPTDSDVFLWSPHGPVWSTPGGPPALAPEAASIVWRTVLERPADVLASAVANGAAQLAVVGLGDTLGPDHFAGSVAPAIHDLFPANEQARFAASLQHADRLRQWAEPLRGPRAILLLAGALATPLVLIRALRRREQATAGLAAIVLAGVLGNAAATGALSGPHDRYQARIAWLLLLPPLLAAASALRAAPAPRPTPAPSAPAPRNRAAASPSPGRG